MFESLPTATQRSYEEVGPMPVSVIIQLLSYKSCRLCDPGVTSL